MADTEFIIDLTKQWIEQVVIGYDLCPFASQPYENNAVGYIVTNATNIESALHALADAAYSLKTNNINETSLLIFSNGFLNFDIFLDLIELADQMLVDSHFNEELVLAHFHPNYCFEGAEIEGAANYSNRSIYPMLHILKQSSITAASQGTISLEAIPDRNIKTLQKIGVNSLSSKLTLLSKA